MARMHVKPPDIVTTRQPNRSLSDVLKGAQKYKTEEVRELTHADDEQENNLRLYYIKLWK